MRALFGAGMHPLAATRLEQLEAADLTDAKIQAATRLGAPFKVYADEVSPFRVEVARRIAAQQAAGQQADGPLSAALRAQVRTEVAREFFRADHGRDPIDAREIAATIAKLSRPRTQTVAGYDLTFSPVKSVSTLWAVAEPHVAAQIERAHQAAVQDALNFIERHALFTRQGTNGVRQVNVTGLVAAAFTHRDSRAGDPDLHTHVAVANKVQTLDGRWLSIDGRVLFKATVAASETYNSALEHHLRDTLGVRFAERADGDPRLRPIREIVGVDRALNRRWSARRVSIESRRGELARQFQRDHGRPPTPVETLHLAQQATLETRGRICGLIRVSSAASAVGCRASVQARPRPNRTRLNHQPQNSKAREGQPSAGSNPAATARLTRQTPARRNLGTAHFLWSQERSQLVPIGCVSSHARRRLPALGPSR